MTGLPTFGVAPQIAWRELHDLGFSVIPVRVGEKIPAIQWACFQTERASLEELENWQRAGHNAGIVTGAVSGIVVLDCDSPEAVARAKELGIPEGTVSVRTAKGSHFFFRHPGPGSVISNKAGLLPGMDIRGDGGFVVAPGSVHPSGCLYEWDGHPAWSEIPPLPVWLADLLHGGPKAQPCAPSQIVPVGHTAYGQRALDSERAILEAAPVGQRNHQLNRSTFAMAQLAAGGQIEPGMAMGALYDAGHTIGLDPQEIQRTIESGWKAGLRKPRVLPTVDDGPRQSPSIISARALSEMSFAPLHWTIAGLLPEGLAVLAGKPKAGKSFFALQMATAVATGEGRAFGGLHIEPGDVLFCALEDSQRRLKDRLARQYPYGGTPDRLHFATGWPRIGAGGIEELERWCDQHPETRLIILARTIHEASAPGSCEHGLSVVG